MDGSQVFDPKLFAHSTCAASDFYHPRFLQLADDLILPRHRLHRKNWEWAFIADQIDRLPYGSRALAFAVGGEPLVAFAARRGHSVLATDAPEGIAPGWIDGDQQAAGLAALPHGTMDRVEFESRVRFEPCDMRAIPEHFDGFDICWSSCAFEHLGTLEAGLEFVRRSVDTLRPGGLAVHTTEFNLSSDDETVCEGATVLYRLQDIQRLAAELTAAGHYVHPFTVSPDRLAVDDVIDVAPYHHDPHLKLQIGEHVSTSAGLVIRKRA